MLRRDCLEKLAAFTASLSISPSIQDFAGRGAAILSLGDTARKRGLQYGATPEADMAGVPPAYSELFAEHCRLLAPNLSWAHVSRAPGQYDFSTEQGTLDFAQSYSMMLTGAHLLWHEQTPAWFAAAGDSAAARQMVSDHIHAMATRFAGRVYSWNVVNEAINPGDGRADGLRSSPLLAKLGGDYVEFAFRTAREFDQQSVLVYNDYGLELENPEQEGRRRALLVLLDRLLASKAPIGAVGLQTHLKLRDCCFKQEVYGRFLKEIEARGLKIMITELDVLDNGAPSNIAQRDRAVADAYKRVLDVALDSPALISVVTWGLSDRYTWLTPRYNPTFARADGLPGRPLPFDSDFAAKPAYWAVIRAIQGAPKRRALYVE
ncbi:MAG TPA: endo-1,4-beta-xylanase [Terriglobia bacterium]|nr:endo-1,4-beta-xylanase [Terriglobia bacterium]